VRFYSALVQRASALPGVVAAGVTSRLPLDMDGATHGSFEVETGVASSPRHASLQMYAIDDGYLKTMRIPLVTGRRFAPIGVQGPLDVIVSRRAAERLWGDASGRAALGKQVRMIAGGPAYTVIGVAEDVRDYDLAEAPEPTIYLPQAEPTDSMLGWRPRHSMALVIRTAGAPGTIATDAARIVHELDRTLPAFNVRTMSELLRASTARLSFTLMLVGAAAVITVILGAIGLYGVTAYMVTLRRREFGLRIALGADPSGIVAMMMRQGLSLAATGIVAGAVAFAIVARFLKALLYGVAPSDPVALLGAVSLLTAIAALASWLPARRTAAIDPAEALRAE
jgi:hypothetical protein